MFWTLVTAVALSMTALVVSAPVRAFPGQNDESPGKRAVAFNRKTNVWSRLDAGVMDGKVTTSPPDTTRYDRRLDGLVDVGFDAALGSRFGFRLDALAEYSRQREAEAEPPLAPTDRAITTLSPSADVTFVTDKGLEIFVGAMYQKTLAYKEVQTSELGESTKAYQAAALVSRRFGVVRRAGAFAGGFSYQMGAEASRKVEATAFDGSGAVVDDMVFVPSKMAVFGNFRVFDFELTFIQARGLGPRDAAGHTTHTDHFEASFGSTLDFGGLGLKSGLSHRTLAYSRSAFVSLETIPVTAARMLLFLGAPTSHVYAGVIGAYGKDGQSQPEFNAKYELKAAAATMGMQLSL